KHYRYHHILRVRCPGSFHQESLQSQWFLYSPHQHLVYTACRSSWNKSLVPTLHALRTCLSFSEDEHIAAPVQVITLLVYFMIVVSVQADTAGVPLPFRYRFPLLYEAKGLMDG